MRAFHIVYFNLVIGIVLNNKYITYNLPLQVALMIVSDCQTPVILNGEADITNGTTYGKVAPVTCAEGYNLTGATTVECLQTGLWSTNVECITIGTFYCWHRKLMTHSEITFRGPHQISPRICYS